MYRRLVPSVLLALTCALLLGALAPDARALTRDAQTRQNLRLLQVYVERYAAGRSFAYPPASLVKKDGGLTSPVWPTNPWTGKPMAPGASRGSYTYTLAAGGSYTLTGRLSSGLFRLAGGTPSWLTGERAAAAAELHNAQTATATALADAAAARQERDTAQADAAAARAQLAAAAAELAAAEHELADSQADLAAAQADLATTQTALSAAQADLVSAQAARDQALAALSPARDAATRNGLSAIQEILRSLAQGTGILPAEATLTYADSGSSWPSWPFSPFDGQRMVQGTAPGQFTYTPGADGSWSLVGHLTSGDCTLTQGAFDWSARKDQQTIVGATLIGYGLEIEAVLNNDLYPAAVTKAALTTVDPWPANQFFGHDMVDGTSKGDYQYEAVAYGCSGYDLVANLTDGSTYDVAAWTQPLFAPLWRLRVSLKDMTAQGYAQVLKDYVDEWKLAHGGALPTVEEMSAAGAVGSTHTWWPRNPWTLAPMAAGTSTGDFEYTPGAGDAFTIVLHQQPLDAVPGNPSTAIPATYTAE